ncbi:hypothetical protein LUZ61_013570 [Rhynchospora tenuis]|uniref:RING-type E3 ubiquitin transferase n=1 Tax=Rhynchospora tenuis TaxID=198213 RepID=A0AAD5W9C4_9POAL|nr:hypothetical protein LUZ61_013570 [Rhynchospora tenuis]
MNNLTEFTYIELKGGTDDFDDSLMIGKGGYGSVYKGFLRHTSVEILSRVRHPNLVMLVGVCVEAWSLIYELMPNGSLHDPLSSKKRSKSLTWKQRICIASNICSGLIFLHSDKPHGIFHGDLKPANIFLDLNYTGKISDFGICRQLYQTDMRIMPHHRTDNSKGTLPYMDPEYFHSAELTPQYDCTLLALYC